LIICSLDGFLNLYLGLHTLDGLHFSSDFNEILDIIESLEDSGCEGLLYVLDEKGLGDISIHVTVGFREDSGYYFCLV